MAKLKFKESVKESVISDSDERIIEGWASTDDLDRYNEITDPQAFKKSLKTYMKNPVLFFGHESWKLPIGKITKARIKDNGLWVQAKISESADDVWGLIKEGMLKTFSFGYNLLKYDKDEKSGVLTIRELDLHEISVVSIPANPEAMIELAKSKGINLNHKSMEVNTMEKDFKTLEEKVDKLNLQMTNFSKDKPMTEDEARKGMTEIHDAIQAIRDAGKDETSTKADLIELQKKSGDDLIKAVETLQKNIEQKWVTVPKAVHDYNGIDQAKRLGNLEKLNDPKHFKAAIICEDHEKAAARVGMTDQRHLIKELQDASDDLLIVGACMGMTEAEPGGGGTSWKKNPQSVLGISKTYKRYNDLKTECLKAMDTQTASEGAEWLPTLVSATLLSDIDIERGLARRLQRFSMPSASFVWPLSTTDATAYIVSEALNDSNADTFTKSTPGTSKITFTAQGMGAATAVSGEMTEDSIIPAIPFIRSKLLEALRDGEENALINGDNASTHQDTDVAALGSSDIRKIFDGLRLDAIANASKDFSGTLTYALMLSVLKASGKWGLIPGEGFWCPSIDVYYFMLGLSQFTGFDAFASGAVAQQGKLPWAIGHEIVPSAFMRNDLGPVGVNAASDNVHTALMFINPKGTMIGDRRGATIETDRLILTDQTVIVAKQRIDFQKITTSGATPNAIGYNITTAG